MHNIKNKKSKVLFDKFERKSPGADSHHYCPGCGHGTVHNLIAQAIEDLEIQNQTVFCSPVGCSVFGYYYFNTGNVQCAHGRAPAVATGIKRTNPKSIVISYQGDGDLAGIGISNIIHAANRGEHITVFFVNNAIYGMTGGQMAPTTLPGQKTLTTPTGRNVAHEGYPMGMSEIISTLRAPVLVERVSLANGARVLKAKRVIEKALKNQVENRGFSFVEILSPCPVNWKMTPVESRHWMIDHLEKEFPVKNFCEKDPAAECQRDMTLTDISDQDMLELFDLVDDQAENTATIEKDVEPQQIKIAGFGGQGVLSAGSLLASCAINDGFKSTWLPSYGAEMRGGTANVTVNISSKEIGSPIVINPNVLVALNAPSLDAFEKDVTPGGLILVNSSMIKRKVERSDVEVVYIDATDMAKKLEVLPTANVMILTIYALKTGIFTVESLRKSIRENLKRQELVEINMTAIDMAVEFYNDNLI